MERKKTPKHKRHLYILQGLVDLFIRTGKPVSSEALQAAGMDDISASTIRNHFAKLEASGFLQQAHSSGGRIPTDSAFKLYAMQHLEEGHLDKKKEAFLRSRLAGEEKEVARYLQRAADVVSDATGCSCFISSPRFDQDVVRRVKVVEIDPTRLLCILITDFGMIRTETLNVAERVDVAEIEAYFMYRLEGGVEPQMAAKEVAKSLYNEMMLRHIASYTNFHAEDIIKTGFSKLLDYPEFQEASLLAGGLSLFENPTEMRRMLRESISLGEVKCWIGEEGKPGCAVVAMPYKIHGKVVGAIAILGPSRLPYAKVFQTLGSAAKIVSETLTQTLVKFQITYRQPSGQQAHLEMNNQLLLSNHGESHD